MRNFIRLIFFIFGIIVKRERERQTDRQKEKRRRREGERERHRFVTKEIL